MPYGKIKVDFLEDSSGNVKNTSDIGSSSVALNDLTNVSVASPSDNDVLTYDNATSTWVAEAAAGGGGGASALNDLSDAATWNGTQGIAIGEYAGETIIANNGTQKCIAIGIRAVQSNQYGQYITAVGQNAGQNLTASNNTCIGYFAGSTLTSGENNTILGANSAPSSATVSNEVTLGDSNVTALRCAVTSITSISDSRDKKDIADINVGLDFINAVRPVSFEWDLRERQPVLDEDGNQVGEKQPRAGLKEYGFIAQELQAVQDQFGTEDYSRLVNTNNPDKLEADTFRLFPILVKAVQELSATNAALEARITALENA